MAFTTYAIPTILGELRRFCRDTRWAAHVPRSTQERVQALRRAEDDHFARQGRSPRPTEAASTLHWSVEEVIEARMAAGCLNPRSLNEPLRWTDGTPGEAIGLVGGEDSGFADADRRDELERALSRLTHQERRALRLRGEAGWSTPEIARLMRLSTPQAARLVRRALHARRVALRGDGNIRSAAEPTR